MKTISHPSPAFYPCNRALQFLPVPLSLTCTLQTLCITGLLISYETPNLLDSVMWTVPTLLCILVRPSLISYVHRTLSPRHAELVLVAYSVAGAAIGAFLVAATGLFLGGNTTRGAARIGVAMLGWTITSAAFQLAEFFGDKAKERLRELGYPQRDDQLAKNVGEILGYCIGFAVCYQFGGKTMKKFHTCCGMLYLTCSLISMLYFLYLSNSSPSNLTLYPQQTPQSSLYLNRKLSWPERIQHYLPGYLQLRASYGYDRWIMMVQFCYLYIVDSLLIYGTMWAIGAREYLGEKRGIAYNQGLTDTIAVLVLAIIVASVDVLGVGVRAMALKDKWKIGVALALLVAISAVAFGLFMQPKYSTIMLLSLLIGSLQGYHKSTLSPIFSGSPIFQATGQLVCRLQKLLILCPIPFLIMIVLNRDDITDVLLTIPVIVGTVVVAGGLIWEQGRASQVQAVVRVSDEKAKENEDLQEKQDKVKKQEKLQSNEKNSQSEKDESKVKND